MDRVSIIALIFIVAYPVFVGFKLHAALSHRRLRFKNESTRLEWLDVIGGGIIFDWRTLLWFYLIATQWS